jgi:hypothetical protein
MRREPTALAPVPSDPDAVDWDDRLDEIDEWLDGLRGRIEATQKAYREATPDA